jgi:site-specific recombinase XerD
MTVKQVSDPCLREAGRGFIISLKASNRYSESYLDSLERTVALVAFYSEEHDWPPVGGITTAHIEEYLTYLQSRHRWFGTREANDPQTVSQGYIEAQYRRLKRFFNWLVDRGHIETNPLNRVPPPKVDERVVPTVSEDDFLRLLRLSDPEKARTKKERLRLTRDRAVLYVLWDTPARRNEVAGLTIDDVDLEEGALLVRGKGGRERRMPIGSSVREVLWQYEQVRGMMAFGEKAYWTNERGQAMQPGWLYSLLKRLGARAGVPGLHTHRFRHTYAMAALRSGMPERVLMYAGGWKKIPDTYFRTLGAEDAARVHQEISPADRLGQAAKRKARGSSRGRL